MSQNLHPELHRIEVQYDQIVEAWSNGRIDPYEGQRQLENLVATDANGVRWRINPETAQWEADWGEGWQAADPAGFAEPEVQQVDDWSMPAHPGGEFWAGEGQVEVPEGWGQDGGDAPDWLPPNAANDPGQWGQPAGWGGQPPVDAPPVGGHYTGFDGGRDVGFGPYGPEAASAGQPGGFNPADMYGQAPAQMAGATHPQWGEEPDKKPNPVSQLAGKLAGVNRRILIGVGAVVVLAVVYFMFLGGGGRGCNAADITIGDAGPNTQEVISCVLGANLMTAVGQVDEGVYTFNPQGPVTRTDLSRTLGLTWLAIGGEALAAPVPPDVDAVRTEQPITSEAIVAAYAAGFVEGNTLGDDPVDGQTVIDEVGRLWAATNRGKGVGGMAGLTDAGILGGELNIGPGEVTRLQLARLVWAIYESGADAVEPGAYQPDEGENGLELPGEDVDISTPTNVADPNVLPTPQDLETALAALRSGSRENADVAVSRPGPATRIALEAARFMGYAQAGVEIRLVGGGVAGDEEGVVLVTLEAVDTNTDTLLGRATPRLEVEDGMWKFRNWPVFEAINPDEEG